MSINSLAGNCVIAGKAAIGAAIAYNAINGHVIAQVTGTGTSVETANAINIFADWTGKVNSVAVGGGAALYATINGSFAFNGVGVDISDAFTSIDSGDINED